MKRDGLPAVDDGNADPKSRCSSSAIEVLDLACRAKGDDLPACWRLFELARPVLWLTALRCCSDASLLEDLDGELYVLFLRRLRQFDPQRGVYFFTYLRQGLAKEIRRLIGRVQRTMGPHAAPACASDADDGAEPCYACRRALLMVRSEPADAGGIDEALVEGLAIRQAFATVSPSARAVIEQRMQGRPYEEIAAELQLTPEGCRQLYHRGLDHLRRVLNEESADAVTKCQTGCPPNGASRTPASHAAARAGEQTTKKQVGRTGNAASERRPAPAGHPAPEETPMLPSEPTITACILTRNEEHRIEDALRSLQGWIDEILVIDNESEDGTVAAARRYTDRILTAPRAACFDAARNLAIEHAAGDWIFYLDADERVPPRLGQELRRLVREEGNDFEALLIPFKHYFCGAWIRHSGWWPGYTRPQLLKKGRFRYNERLHSGVQVDGRTLFFPADDPELAILHHSYDDLRHYLEKLNRYTDGEAESLLADGASHSWQAQLAHLVHDWQIYYERGRGDLDGLHGFVLAFMAGIYRFVSRAKLWDLRRQRGELSGPEPVPADLREILEFMARIVQEGAEPWLQAECPVPGARCPAAAVPRAARDDRHPGEPSEPSREHRAPRTAHCPSSGTRRCSTRAGMPTKRATSSWACWTQGSPSPWHRRAGERMTPGSRRRHGRVSRRTRFPSTHPRSCSSRTPCPRSSSLRRRRGSTSRAPCSRRTGCRPAGRRC
jgi:RNA polymerase sigma factor (sigma-70 family)